MNLFQAIVLGAIQGVTEFLPISSSGHLTLGRLLMGIQQDALAVAAFDILIQLGTWIAVVIFFRRELIAIVVDTWGALRGRPGPQARLGWLLILATIPALIVGWLIRDSILGELNGLFFTGVFMLANTLLLAIAEWVDRRSRSEKTLTAFDAVWIGAFQALALLPAVSRSAATLAGGMTRQLPRAEAARFSFLMAVPVMPAAAVVGLLNLGAFPDAADILLPLFIGFLVSMVVGFFTIRWLLNYFSRKSSIPFALYCLVLGVATIAASFIS